MTLDRRRHPRKEINHEFRDVEDFLREYALNVSLDGVFIRTSEVLPVGTPVQLKFSVLGEDWETIEGEGEVVRSVEAEDSEEPGMGVVFTRGSKCSLWVRDVFVIRASASAEAASPDIAQSVRQRSTPTLRRGLSGAFER